MDREEFLIFVWPKLHERERIVLSHRFGLNGETRKTYKAIAIYLDRSLQRMRDVTMKGLKKLKKFYKQKMFKEMPEDWFIHRAHKS